MKEHTYWRYSLALPLVCPALAFTLIWVLSLGGQGPSKVAQALETIFLSGYLLGIPYAVFAAVLLVLLWSRSILAYKRVAVAAPVVFVVLLACGIAIYLLITRGTVGDVFTPGMLGIYLLALIMGYAYVVLVYTGAWVLIRLNRLEIDAVPREHSA